MFENVAFGLRLRKISAAQRDKRAIEMLDLVGLSTQADRYPHQISGGQQQRVALARALVNSPAALLLDEPLGALDLKLRQEMQVFLKELQQDPVSRKALHIDFVRIEMTEKIRVKVSVEVVGVVGTVRQIALDGDPTWDLYLTYPQIHPDNVDAAAANPVARTVTTFGSVLGTICARPFRSGEPDRSTPSGVLLRGQLDFWPTS